MASVGANEFVFSSILPTGILLAGDTGLAFIEDAGSCGSSVVSVVRGKRVATYKNCSSGSRGKLV